MKNFLNPIFTVLGFGPGLFGRSPKKDDVGAGVKRARAREAEQRRLQDERLKNAGESRITRQQRRSFAIRGR